MLVGLRPPVIKLEHGFRNSPKRCCGQATASANDPACCPGPDGPLETRFPVLLSRYLLPVMKETPADAQIVSHQLMLRAGLIRQTAAGIYAWLPLGLRVLDRISAIVRREQDRAGAVELLMPTIQSADLWRQSGRYDAYGPEMLRFQDRGG